MKTIIYSCSKSMSSKELIATTDAEVDVHFPELDWSAGGIPLADHDQADVAHQLIGQTFITVSETIIVTILREIHEGRLTAADVELYRDGARVEISSDGKIIGS
jgi:hypothetical protein